MKVWNIRSAFNDSFNSLYDWTKTIKVAKKGLKQNRNLASELINQNLKNLVCSVRDFSTTELLPIWLFEIENLVSELSWDIRMAETISSCLLVISYLAAFGNYGWYSFQLPACLRLFWNKMKLEMKKTLILLLLV